MSNPNDPFNDPAVNEPIAGYGTTPPGTHPIEADGPAHQAADYESAPDRSVAAPDRIWKQALKSPRIVIGGGIILFMLALCVGTIPLTTVDGNHLYFDNQTFPISASPDSSFAMWFGTDDIGRSILARSLLGGSISMAVGAAAAIIAVVLGVSTGLFAGYTGGWVDAALMRFVDIMYGLPYILLVILFSVALDKPLTSMFISLGVEGPEMAANVVVLFLSIGLVSWLTMARVVRGQVLSLRGTPFIEAAYAAGLPKWRIFLNHLLPNLVGPVIVYATLTVPQAILQESFLSFLGIGITEPLPSWGLLASSGLNNAFKPIDPYWWQVAAPCALLAVTLLALNFLGDGLRDLFDPKREAAKI